MEDDFDLDNMIDSINLTGQWQPSSMPIIMDSNLNSQILDDLLLSADDSPPSNSNNNDDIINALINTPISPFGTDDISEFISAPIGELPRQSTIEDTLEKMNLDQSQTDILSSSICIQTGSFSVEQKEIDNSILAKQIVREQQRMYKNASKSRKTSGYQSPSSTVGPIDVLSSYGVCQPCTTLQIQSDFSYSQQQLFQFDTMESKKIQILSHPRPNFRPRTQNESKNASHYIRCEGSGPYEYPTIAVSQMWARQSLKNIIEVTLVAKDKLPHDYAIDNKTSKSSFEDDALIFRQNESHTLYFCLTAEDFKNGFKSFMIEYIKSKQDGTITKDLIKTRQLEQSMLRFTRIFQSEQHTFQRDDESAEYSGIMSEAYGDVAVEHMGPRFAPMGGNERAYALLKGRFSKDDVTVFITEDTTGWRQQVPITKNGNLVYFVIPPFPYSQFDRAVTNIFMYYKGEEFHQAPFIYKGSLDEELAGLDLNDSTVETNTHPPPPSPPNSFNALEFFSATGACPTTRSSRKSSTAKRTKRLNNK
jgi:hypothetical protein